MHSFLAIRIFDKGHSNDKKYIILYLFSSPGESVTNTGKLEEKLLLKLITANLRASIKNYIRDPPSAIRQVSNDTRTAVELIVYYIVVFNSGLF